MPSRDDESPQQQLAGLGVGVFRPSPDVRVPSVGELASLTVRMVTSDDPRLVASLPCLFVLHDGVAAAAALEASSAIDAPCRERLGLCWRLARAFAIQWEPDIVFLFGRPRCLPELPFEPDGLPEPGDQCGERCVAVARELYTDAPGGNPVTDLIDTFRTWLRQTELERSPAGHA